MTTWLMGDKPDLPLDPEFVACVDDFIVADRHMAEKEKGTARGQAPAVSSAAPDAPRRPRGAGQRRPAPQLAGHPDLAQAPAVRPMSWFVVVKCNRCPLHVADPIEGSKGP